MLSAANLEGRDAVERDDFGQRESCMEYIITTTRYRIQRSKVLNVDELDQAGNIVAHWCFAPKGYLPMGDVLLAQKIALETMERETLKMPNRNFIHERLIAPSNAP